MALGLLEIIATTLKGDAVYIRKYHALILAAAYVLMQYNNTISYDIVSLSDRMQP